MKTRLLGKLMLALVLGMVLVAQGADKPSAGKATGAAKAAKGATDAAAKAAGKAAEADAAAAGAKYPDTAEGKAADEADKAADAADAAAADAQKEADKAANDADDAHAKADKTGKQSDQDKAAEADKKAADADKAAADAEKAAADADKAADKADDKADPFGKNLRKKARDARREARRARRAAAAAIRFAKKCAEMLDESSEKNRKKKEEMIDTLDGYRDQVNQMALAPPPIGAASLSDAAAALQLVSSIEGTGQTIGHVATLHITNAGNNPWAGTLVVAPVLVSLDGACQPYGLSGNPPPTLPPGWTWTIFGPMPPPRITAPFDTAPTPRQPTGPTLPFIIGLSGTLAADATADISLDGTCLDGHKPAVAQGESGKVAFADPSAPETGKQWGDTLRAMQTIASTAQSLQARGEFTTPFSTDPAKELQTIIQWTTWVYTSAGTDKPITRADLADKVVEQAGATTAEQKAALEPGISQIWTSVQLTGAKAKVL